MHPKKWEVGYVMIKQHALGPAAFLMAALALFAFLSLVHVVGEVTAVALFADLFLIQFAAMACGTHQFSMFALERKLGFLVMVEVCFIPAFFSMASITLLAVTPVMLIILFVAAVTILFRFYFINRVFMTGHTDNFSMLAS